MPAATRGQATRRPVGYMPPPRNVRAAAITRSQTPSDQTTTVSANNETTPRLVPANISQPTEPAAPNRSQTPIQQAVEDPEANEASTRNARVRRPVRATARRARARRAPTHSPPPRPPTKFSDNPAYPHLYQEKLIFLKVGLNIYGNAAMPHQMPLWRHLGLKEPPSAAYLAKMIDSVPDGSPKQVAHRIPSSGYSSTPDTLRVTGRPRFSRMQSREARQAANREHQPTRSRAPDRFAADRFGLDLILRAAAATAIENGEVEDLSAEEESSDVQMTEPVRANNVESLESLRQQAGPSGPYL